MISKEVFCTALRLWDKQFDKDCEVIAFFDEQYEAKSRLFLEAPEGLSQILCKHCEAVQNRAKII